MTETAHILEPFFADFTPVQWQQLEQLGHLYAGWNQQINVISRKDIDHFYTHHVLHSLAIATQFTFSAGARVLDLGTGGGFPGIPLALFFPETQFLLVDSIGKKLKVIEAVAAELNITNIQTRHARAETIPERGFEAVVSRAVAPLADLWRWSKPLLHRQGLGLICLKGGDLTAEIAASGRKPNVWELEPLFQHPYFKEKYLLQVMP